MHTRTHAPVLQRDSDLDNAGILPKLQPSGVRDAIVPAPEQDANRTGTAAMINMCTSNTGLDCGHRSERKRRVGMAQGKGDGTAWSVSRGGGWGGIEWGVGG